MIAQPKPLQQILATVAQQSTRDFGRGFSYCVLKRMVKLY